MNFFSWLNDDILAMPTTILFAAAALFLTLKTRFIQIRAFPAFIRMITQGVKEKHEKTNDRSISPFHALFAAMATTIGTGNVVGPSIAIMAGGPGALFWLLVYIFFGSVTKLTEVSYALATRFRTPQGYIVGGPVQYLKSVSMTLSHWYGIVIIFLFAIWSSLQSNTLANIVAQEGIPHAAVGIALALFAYIALQGGAKRVGSLASALVPIMFIMYVTFSLFILCKNPSALLSAIALVYRSVINPEAFFGGVCGSAVFHAMNAGFSRAIFITEAGLGTSSIAHATANTARPIDQGILAMGSMVADAILCSISGLLVLVTQVWKFPSDSVGSTLIYEAFKLNAPPMAKWVLIASLALFVLTTVMGNSFNGLQSFGALTNHRYRPLYIACTVIMIFCGALLPMPLIWEISDTLLRLVAIPNLIGLMILSIKRKDVITY
jgi:AGCS family alanine or glycine:cation symporter